jgi:hypothetical protein
MAYGLESNFVIFPEQFFSGLVEVLQQNAEVFNGASANTIRLVTQAMLGDFERESFFKSTAGIVAHRNPSNAASVSDINMTMDQLTSIKVNKRIGPVAQTLDSFRKIAVDPMEFSYLFGTQAGVAVALQYVTSAIASVRGAIQNQSGLQYDNTAQTIPTLNHTALISGMALLGDRADRIVAWVMHSGSYFELMKQQVADKLFQAATATIYSGNVATLGKPVIVTDAVGLTSGSTGSNPLLYDVLGLTEDAVQLIESEERTILSQPVTGQDNLVMRIQGEYAYNVKVKGFDYSITNGGVNPTDAALGTSNNWSWKLADLKEAPGVRITHK